MKCENAVGALEYGLERPLRAFARLCDERLSLTDAKASGVHVSIL